MNRPNRENYEKKGLTLTIKGYEVFDYIFDLEAYCRHLESKLDNELKSCNLEVEKYKRALEKACKRLRDNEKATAYEHRYHTTYVWKRWCMEDE